MGKHSVLVDLTKCVGCRGCQVACKQWHDLPANKTQNTGSYQNPPRRDSSTLTLVEFKEIESPQSIQWIFAKRQCMHCEEPACASACTVGALVKREDGPVSYLDYKCIGCRYCMYACPYGGPSFQWDKQFALIAKCDFCEDRLSVGEKPACVKTCVSGALRYGTREAMLNMALGRVYAPGSQYVKHVYGEHEAGGASWLYISSVPFEKLGFPALPQESAAPISQEIMHATPAVAVGMALFLTGIYKVIERRIRLSGGPHVHGKEAEHAQADH